MSRSLPGQIKLLVSVRNAAEAIAALDGGANIIDVKEPSRGPLGMADPTTIAAVVAAVRDRAPVSAALGELFDDPDLTALPPGIAYAKMGLYDAPRPWRKKLAAKFAQVPNVKPIAAAYAAFDGFEERHIGWNQVGDVIQWAIDHHAAGVLIDTHRKDSQNLFNTATGLRAAEHIRHARAAGLSIALAGSLAGNSFSQAVALGPDIVAVRGAACTGNNRNAAVDASRVRALADLIAAHNAQPVSTPG